MEAITEICCTSIIEALCKSIGRQFGYLIDWKDSIDEFADEVNKLSLAQERIQTMVNTALRNAEDIHNDVLEWRRKVQSMENDKRRLLQGKENLKCVGVCSRYRLGKEGKNKKTVVTGLIEEGKSFVTVGHRPPLTWHRTYSIKYENFDSRELVFNQIMDAIKDDTTYKIGIHGMPGAGKTRMMEEVAKQAQKERLFNEIVEIVVTQNPNLKDLQQKLAEGLNLDSNLPLTEDARKELLSQRMSKNGKKILLMVDDVWDDEIKLEDIGIPATNDHTMGCKILLTSRRQDVCKAMGVEKEFTIGLLSESEALSLFEKKVRYSIECHEMRSLAKAVCKECAGLPLAILAVGGVLVLNKSKQVWEDALQKLRNSKGEDIVGLPRKVKKLYSRIELSYNYLETDDAKSIFLLCPLFGEDAEISIDDLVSYGIGLRLFGGGYTMKTARNRAGAMVDTLKISSLLLEGRNENFVKMHDVIRDVAISIASKKEDAMILVKEGVEKWPEEDEYKGCRAISLRFNKDCVLPDDLECPELRTLKLECRLEWFHHPPEVPSSFFDGMEKLEVLCLSNIRISTLPSSLKNLRMLRLYKCQLVSLAFLKELRKLEVLSIQHFDLKDLALEIGQLDSLRLLDLRNLENLKILPSGVISNLYQLEELYIGESFDRQEVEGNASLMEINSLTHLISLEVDVPSVMLLPLNELLFKSLIRFRISIGNWDCSEDIPSTVTKVLRLIRIPYKKELNILMEKAQVVYLIKVEGLKNVFDDRYGEGFQDLESLKVYECDDILEHLFGKPKLINSQTRGPNCVFGSFSKLSVLEIGNCQQLRYLFSTAIARGLAKLQELNVHGCEILEEIIRDDQQVMEPIIFHGLKKMDLWRLPKLRSLYFNMKNTSTSTLTQALFNDKVAFPALEKLCIIGLESHQSQSFLAKEAEDSFRHKAFTGRLCAYSHLTSLKISNCDNLTNIFSPSAARCLVQLQKLIVSYCWKMEEIVAVEIGHLGEDGEEDLVHDEIIVFPQLKRIEFRNLPNLRSFCSSSTRGSKKQGEETVELNIPRVDALFNHKVAFPALEKLYINELKRPTTIFDDQLQSQSKEAEDSFRSLRYMQVSACSKLMNLFWPSIARRLVHLESLDVSDCEGMIEIVALEMGPSIQYGEVEEEEEEEEDLVQIIVFPQLKYIQFRNLPNLTRFFYYTGGSKKSLFNHKVAFPALEKLYINELKRPTAIFDDQLQSQSKEAEDSFRSLRYMQVSACSKLMNLFWPSIARRLVHLETLNVYDCEGMIEIVALEMGPSIQYGEVEEEEEEEDLVQIIVFPQLKLIQFQNLPNLTRFFYYTGGSEKSLFNHKVAFPALENLYIVGLERPRAIWDDQSQSFLVKEAEDSFRHSAGRLCAYSHLTSLDISNSDSLTNIFLPSTARCLVHLQELIVCNCEKMEEIVAVEMGQLGEDGEEDLVHDDIIVFPQLKLIKFQNLPNLRSFCCSTRGSKKWMPSSTTRLNSQL